MTPVPCEVCVYPTNVVFRNLPPEVEANLQAAYTWTDPKSSYMLKRHREKVHPRPMSWCYVCRDQGQQCLYQRHSLPIGFLTEVTSLLDQWGVDYRVCDFRQAAPVSQYDWHYSLNLRPYQQDILDALLVNQYGVVEAATGAGKTVVAAALVCELGLPTLILTPTKVVFQQFWEEFTTHTDCPLGQIASGKQEHATVQIAITKSLTDQDGKVRSQFLQDRQLLIVDEFHQSAAATWSEIVEACPAHYRFGFSATPFRKTDLECNMLRGMAGNVIAKIGTEELQDEGYLCPTDIRMLTIPTSYDRRYQDEKGDWQETCFADRYRQAIVENQRRNEAISQVVSDHNSSGEKVLVIVSWTDHAELLLAELPPAIYLSGKDSPKQTQAKRDQFKTATGGICVGSPIVDVGFDVPAVDVVVMAGGGSYEGRQRQRLGRGLRPSPGKDKVIVYDFIDDDRGTGGRPTFYQHSLERMAAYRSVGQEPRQWDRLQHQFA